MRIIQTCPQLPPPSQLVTRNHGMGQSWPDKSGTAGFTFQNFISRRIFGYTFGFLFCTDPAKLCEKNPRTQNIIHRPSRDPLSRLFIFLLTCEI